ncbi:heat shock protein beta-11-like [Rhinatrema bivittatum]|uniref:heat shock protein beta-11-like n=1 Tax=Rhinatrema bivittatum TaxID=194408 RepID=UPI00112CF43C|nr:heat shock protein beta-11-like [Rhinatrema bivittatum]
MLCSRLLQPSFSSLLPFLEPMHTLWPASQPIFPQIEQSRIRRMGDVKETMQLLEEVHQFLLEEMGLAPVVRGRPSGQALPSSGQTEKADKAFTVSLAIKDFSPEELSVKLVGRKLLVTGTKETKSEDEKGVCSYKYELFRREWDVPEDLNPEELTCSVSSEGQLHIEGPCLASPACTDRTVPIHLCPEISSAA